MRPTNEWFTPEKLRRLYGTYAAIVAVVTLVPVAAVVAFTPWPGPAIAVGAWLATFGFLAWWVSAFAETAAYRLTEDDVEYRRGVWFRKHSEVPYDRITNVDTRQGPVQRWIGVGAIGLHTAGYAAQTGAELTITGIVDYEAVKTQILTAVHERPSVATEGADERREPTRRAATTDTADPDLLAEVRAIRTLLEDRVETEV